MHLAVEIFDKFNRIHLASHPSENDEALIQTRLPIKVRISCRRVESRSVDIKISRAHAKWIFARGINATTSCGGTRLMENAR